MKFDDLPPVLQRVWAATGATTAAEVAEFLGVPAANVRMWVYKGEVPAARLQEIAIKTGRPLNWLVTGQGPAVQWMADAPQTLRDSVYESLEQHNERARLVRAIAELPPRVQRLIDDYLSADEIDQRVIERTAALARAAPKPAPPEQTAPPPPARRANKK